MTALKLRPQQPLPLLRRRHKPQEMLASSRQRALANALVLVEIGGLPGLLVGGFHDAPWVTGRLYAFWMAGANFLAFRAGDFGDGRT